MAAADDLDLEVVRARRARERRRETWAGAGLVLALCAAALLVADRVWLEATGTPPPGPGSPAPAFDGRSLEGRPIRLEALRGRVVLLDFWATWCPPCVASMPTLDRLHDELGERGLTVIGVNQEPGEAPRVRAFLESRGLDFPVVMDAGAIAQTYGVRSLPTTFLVDREGEVRASYRGLIPEARLEAAIRDLLAEP